MKTDALIDMLARGPVAIDPAPARRRLSLALAGGALVALLLTLGLLGARTDVDAALVDPMSWVKLGSCITLAAFATPLALRLGRPGSLAGAAVWGIVVPALGLWALAAIALLRVPAGERLGLLLGQSWTSCPWLIAALSLPAFALLLWAARAMAPVRPRLAGACAGLLAGAIGAAAYSLHCGESAAPFVATWYLAGIALPALAGAAFGARLLRW
jgi:hypothetical protein